MTKRPIGAAISRLALAACAVLAPTGCATPPAPPQPAAMLPPAGTQFDGVYTGRNDAVSGWGFWCGAPSYPRTIAVSGGHFDYPFLVNPPRTTPVAVQIASDGTFAARMLYGTDDPGPRALYVTAWVTVTGRVAAGELDAVVTDLRCVRRLTARHG